MRVRSLASLSGLRSQRCCELWCISYRCVSDLALLWLWCRPAAVALVGPLAWESPNATDEALKKREKKNFCLAPSLNYILHSLCHPALREKEKMCPLFYQNRIPCFRLDTPMGSSLLRISGFFLLPPLKTFSSLPISKHKDNKIITIIINGLLTYSKPSL